jgi:YHS domain-containing protein
VAAVASTESLPKEAKVIAIDPVCNMTVEEEEAAANAEYEGKTFYFCSVGCKNDFEEDPQAFLRQE